MSCRRESDSMGHPAPKLDTNSTPLTPQPTPAAAPADTTGTGRVVRVDENGVAVGPRIPAWAIDGGELTSVSHQALRVYLVLAKYRNNGSRIAYPSQRTITQEAKIKSRSLLSAVAELEAAGLVRVLEVGSGKRSTRYQLVNVPDGARTVGPGENIDGDGPDEPGPSDSPGKDTKPANGTRKRTGNGQSENKGREALGNQENRPQCDASASLPDASASLSEVSASLDSGPKNATNPADTKDCGPPEAESQGIRTNSYRTNSTTTNESVVVQDTREQKSKKPSPQEQVKNFTDFVLKLNPKWERDKTLKSEVPKLLAEYDFDMDMQDVVAKWTKNPQIDCFNGVAYHVRLTCKTKAEKQAERDFREKQRAERRRQDAEARANAVPVGKRRSELIAAGKLAIRSGGKVTVSKGAAYATSAG